MYFATELTEGDYSVLLWIQENLRTPGGDIFWNVVTNGVFWVFAFLAAWLILRNRKQGRQAALYAGTALLLALAGKEILKHLILRPRPYEAFYDLIPVVHAGGSSFPSGHTAAAFAIVYRLWCWQLWRRFPAFIWASIIPVTWRAASCWPAAPRFWRGRLSRPCSTLPADTWKMRRSSHSPAGVSADLDL